MLPLLPGFNRRNAQLFPRSDLGRPKRDGHAEPPIEARAFVESMARSKKTSISHQTPLKWTHVYSTLP